MPLVSYLDKRKIELLRKEVKLSTGIKLKTTSWWLIHESQLREIKLKSSNNWGSAIIIIIISISEAFYLGTKSLRFGKGLKMVKKL